MNARILFVCYGNACRSPMAAALFEAMVGKDPLVQSVGVEVASAGTHAVLDSATPETIAVMAERGIDLNGHRPRTISRSLVNWADLVLVMESGHRAEVIYWFPEALSKTHLLSEYVGDSGDIRDPYYKGIEAYRDCAARLESLLDRLADKIRVDRAS